MYLHLLDTLGIQRAVLVQPSIYGSDNTLLLYLFWELTTVLSFLLVGHYAERATSRRAATQALLVTTFGGLAMLTGIIMLGTLAGTYRLSDLVAHAHTGRSDAPHLAGGGPQLGDPGVGARAERRRGRAQNRADGLARGLKRRRRDQGRGGLTDFDGDRVEVEEIVGR